MSYCGAPRAFVIYIYIYMYTRISIYIYIYTYMYVYKCVWSRDTQTSMRRKCRVVLQCGPQGLLAQIQCLQFWETGVRLCHHNWSPERCALETGMVDVLKKINMERRSKSKDPTTIAACGQVMLSTQFMDIAGAAPRASLLLGRSCTTNYIYIYIYMYICIYIYTHIHICRLRLCRRPPFSHAVRYKRFILN